MLLCERLHQRVWTIAFLFLASHSIVGARLKVAVGVHFIRQRTNVNVSMPTQYPKEETITNSRNDHDNGTFSEPHMNDPQRSNFLAMVTGGDVSYGILAAWLEKPFSRTRLLSIVYYAVDWSGSLTSSIALELEVGPQDDK